MLSIFSGMKRKIRRSGDRKKNAFACDGVGLFTSSFWRETLVTDLFEECFLFSSTVCLQGLALCVSIALVMLLCVLCFELLDFFDVVL